MKLHRLACHSAAIVWVGCGFLSTTLAREPSVLFRGDPDKPNTTQAARLEAVRSIPMDQLAPSARAKVAWVLENTSVFRRLPIRVVSCDPDLYLFLVRHPDVVVNIWELFGATHLTVRQVGSDLYQVTDDVGTSGTLQILYRAGDLHIAYVEGTYTGKLFGHHVRARGIVILHSAFIRDAAGRCLVTSRLDAFMNIEPGGAEFLTKTFQPLVGKVADLNFTQTVDFLGSLSRTAEVNQRGMQRLASRLEKVRPEVRQQFAELAAQVAERAQRSSPTARVSAATGPINAPAKVPLVAKRPGANDSPDGK